MNPGDLVGFRTPGAFAWCIRLGQRFAGVQHNDITHIAVVTEASADPLIVQSVRRVNTVRLSSYGAVPHIVIPSPLGPDDPRRADGVAFARAQLGRKYGVLSVLSRAWNCVTPRWVQFGISRAGDMDCSALGARVFEHEGVVIPWPDAFQVMPGQLADEYAKETSA